MRRIVQFFIVVSVVTTGAHAATRDARLTNTTGYNYNYMYPYMNNQMRTNLNPGVTTSQSSNLIDTVVKTTKISQPRRVVARSAKKTTTAKSNTTRSASPNTTGRRVVARSGIRTGGAPRNTNRDNTNFLTDTSNRYNNSYTYRAEEKARGTTSAITERVTSTRCLADYTECMNNYCLRPDTAYNRCYCSSRLSQIDAKYQNKINNLITQLAKIQGTNNWTDAEMNEYWMATVGKYSNSNSWTNIENALNIDWANTESRVRGQNAFTTGHEYCVQHLQGCSYMATNLRDAYRSEIAGDCNTYEQSLQRIKDVAESIVESYK